MKKIQDVFEKYHKRLDYLDLELILGQVLKKDRSFIIAHPEHRLPKALEQKAESFIKRRLKHEPMAYILGRKEFYGLEFAVNRHTLIPRPETELLVEKTLQNINNTETRKIAIIDVGTGSGNIIISLAKNLPKKKSLRFIATDVSSGAIRTAKKNSVRHNVSKNILFVKSDILSGLKSYFHKNNFRVIIFVSNLPYLSKNIYQKTSPDIKRYEPRSALFSENRGLAHYEKFFREIKLIKFNLPETEMFFLLEFSPEQKLALDHRLKKIFPNNKSSFYKDYSGRFRVMLGQL
jgi:release factor glutamine methyltransferase